MACFAPTPRCGSHVMLFGHSQYQWALLCFVETPGLRAEPRPDRERVLENPRMPKLVPHWSPA